MSVDLTPEMLDGIEAAMREKPHSTFVSPDTVLALVAAARERDELREAVARVEELHVRTENDYPGWEDWCLGCSMDWPCETVEALRGEDQ